MNAPEVVPQVDGAGRLPAAFARRARVQYQRGLLTALDAILESGFLAGIQTVEWSITAAGDEIHGTVTEPDQARRDAVYQDWRHAISTMEYLGRPVFGPPDADADHQSPEIIRQSARWSIKTDGILPITVELNVTIQRQATIRPLSDINADTSIDLPVRNGGAE